MEVHVRFMNAYNANPNTRYAMDINGWQEIEVIRLDLDEKLHDFSMSEEVREKVEADMIADFKKGRKRERE